MNANKFRVAIFGLLGLVSALGASFEAASIHPAADDAVFFAKPPGNGKFTGSGVTARFMVMLAWNLQESQIVGGPDWFATDRWTVEAKGDAGGDAREMLQNMLQERFGLRVHRETREISAYVLMVGSGGSKLKANDTGSTNVRIGGNSIGLDGGDMPRLTQLLAGVVEKPIVNRTGLTGRYDVALHWGEDESIFSAIQEQLGLRLVSQKAAVEVLVIDRIERPSAN